MLKKGILASLLVLLFAGAFAERRQVMLDKVVAVVGGSSILYSDVADYAHQLTAQRRQQGYTSDRDPMNEALEAMLTQKLLYNQAQIDSVTINDSWLGAVSTSVETSSKVSCLLLRRKRILRPRAMASSSVSSLPAPLPGNQPVRRFSKLQSQIIPILRRSLAALLPANTQRPSGIFTAAHTLKGQRS